MRSPTLHGKRGLGAKPNLTSNQNIQLQIVAATWRIKTKIDFAFHQIILALIIIIIIIIIIMLININVHTNLWQKPVGLCVCEIDLDNSF